MRRSVLRAPLITASLSFTFCSSAAWSAASSDPNGVNAGPLFRYHDGFRNKVANVLPFDAKPTALLVNRLMSYASSRNLSMAVIAASKEANA